MAGIGFILCALVMCIVIAVAKAKPPQPLV